VPARRATPPWRSGYPHLARSPPFIAATDMLGTLRARLLPRHTQFSSTAQAVLHTPISNLAAAVCPTFSPPCEPKRERATELRVGPSRTVERHRMEICAGLSVKAEYLYVGLGTQSASSPAYGHTSAA
jgi:hypothetical protein